MSLLWQTEWTQWHWMTKGHWRCLEWRVSVIGKYTVPINWFLQSDVEVKLGDWARTLVSQPANQRIIVKTKKKNRHNPQHKNKTKQNIFLNYETDKKEQVISVVDKDMAPASNTFQKPSSTNNWPESSYAPNIIQPHVKTKGHHKWTIQNKSSHLHQSIADIYISHYYKNMYMHILFWNVAFEVFQENEWKAGEVISWE